MRNLIAALVLLMPWVGGDPGSGGVWVDDPNNYDEVIHAMWTGLSYADDPGSSGPNAPWRAAYNAQAARRVQAGDEGFNLSDTYFGSGPGQAAMLAAGLSPGLSSVANGGTFLGAYGASAPVADFTDGANAAGWAQTPLQSAAQGLGSGGADFAAADAAQLTAQGLSQAQVAQTLIGSGVDPFVAHDLAQLSAQGLTASQMAPLAFQSAGGSYAGVMPGFGLGATAAGIGASAAASGFGTAAGQAAAGGAASGLISKIMNGTATADDYLSALGRAAPALGGYLAAGKQADAFQQLADQTQQRYESNLALGAPYRARLAELYTPEGINGYLTSPDVTTPVQQGTDMLAHSLSTQGNPVGSGNSLQQLQSYASGQLYGKLGEERSRLAGFGGLTAYNSAGAQGPNLQPATAAIGAQGNQYNAIGAGVADVFGSQNDLSDVLKQYLKQSSAAYTG